MDKEATILIVDDDHITQQITKMIFKRANVTNKIWYVDTGDAALDFIHKRNGFEEAPDVDIMYLDLDLPVVTGIDVLESLSNDNINIPTIVLTNSADSVDIQLSETHGAMGYIIKPFSLHSLLETYIYNKNLSLKIIVENNIQ